MESRFTNSFAALALFAGILLFGSETSTAQNNVRLTPKQQQTVEQFLKQLAQKRGETAEKMKETVQDIDPILVGRNVIFSKDWLTVMPYKLTKLQFEAYRNVADVIYDSYVELIGQKPPYGDIILIDTESMHEGPINASGRAYAAWNLVHIHVSGPTLTIIGQEGGWHKTTAHEIAHIFTPHNYGWSANDRESIADFFACYAKETMRLGKFELRYRESRRNFRTDKIETFRGRHEHNGCAFEFYLYGLVDKVGWETYKKAIRSYNDNNFIPNMYEEIPKLEPSATEEEKQSYAKRKAIVSARDFLDRVEHFSGKPDVLRSLSDKGALLDEHFNVKVTQQNLRAPTGMARHTVSPAAVQTARTASLQRPTPVTTPVQQSPTPTLPPEEEIQTLQSEIKELQASLKALPKTRNHEPEAIRLSNQLQTLQNRLNRLSALQSGL